ncbi:putative transcriptional regulatory protein C1F7.11c [Psilocybe cubensis]|uniref:Transcriptional regulatory protein C1F7.11c n=1 Tax=Psilocybe cubensis TaxID=181762 RepID=A0ACB8GU86_PSICU|nr:putative transcriptional regulatory protein C1F7.11c [Psilocybe cubensis]KAH9479083.1 putative transcriptional regulatory protein C1F7.11c [Psilocybe cubensis]
MPVDTTRVISPRRTQKKLTEEELKDIDRKRLLGELSCAECRRLKLRCDKKLPCGSCFRRGCESICPLGILAAGQGTRFILADTQQLHDKIYEMSNRIRQLEDALAILQSTVTDQRHPLLSDELLRIKFGSEAINARKASADNADEDNSTAKSIDALGTLTLGSSGEVQYFGGSAGSERAGEEVEGSEDEDKEANREMFFEIDKLANLFPFTSKGRPNMHGLDLVQSFLPSSERASQLCDSYIKHASFFFRPIKGDDLLQGLLPAIYNIANENRSQATGQSQSQSSGSEEKIMNPHAMATLYFIFALGCLLDLTRPPYSSESERYYDLGRAALSLRSVYDSPNMDSVQAMGLMATYQTLAGKKYTRDSAWCIMSFAAKLAQSVNRDSARWNMDSSTVQRRRNLFWEVFSADVSNSLAMGRPPAIHLSYVDCEFPQDDDASLSSTAEPEDGFWRMKHKFAKNIYNSVADATLTAKPPSYNTVLDLDRKVREISFPASFNPYVTRDVGAEIFNSSSLSLRDFYASQHRTVTMLYLHRSFFAQAMLDHPTNPLLSPFAPSFLTAYRSASVIIKATAHLFERCAAIAMRLWFLINHTFSAAVIVGTVVTRSPNSNIASIAMRDFNLALSLFEKTAAQSSRARVALGVLTKLQEKAKRSYEQISTTGPIEGPFDNPEDIEDDLAIFGGQMKVLSRKGKMNAHQRSSSTSGSITTHSTVSSPQSQSPSSTNASPKLDSQAAAVLGLGLDFPDVHPSLITYLNQDAVRRAMTQGSLQREGNAPPTVSQVNPEAPAGSFGASNATILRGGPIPGVAALLEGNSIIPRQPQHMNTNSDARPSYDDSRTRPGSSFPQLQLPQQYSAGVGLSRDWTQSLGAANPPGILRSNLSSYTDNTVARGAFDNRESTNIPGRNQGGIAFSDSLRSASSGYPRENIFPSTADTNMGQSFAQPFFQRLGGYMTLPEQSQSSAGFNPALDLSRGSMQGATSGVGGTSMSASAGWTDDGVNFADAVEMGLSSGSGMDAGWMSFMRDCGIMDMDG